MRKFTSTHILIVGAAILAIIFFVLPQTDAFDRYQEREWERIESLMDNM